MGDFNLTLPLDAHHVRVVKPALEDFRAKAVVSFIAPREEVMDQTCRNVKYKNFDVSPLVYGIDSDMLKAADITIDRDDYGSCDQYEGGRKILVLIPRAENQTTYVVVYHMPYR